VRRILKPNGSAYPRGTNSVIVHVNTSGNGLIFIQFQLCEIVGVANLSCSTLPFSCWKFQPAKLFGKRNGNLLRNCYPSPYLYHIEKCLVFAILKTVQNIFAINYFSPFDNVYIPTSWWFWCDSGFNIFTLA
jgi:hypothetical protein